MEIDDVMALILPGTPKEKLLYSFNEINTQIWDDYWENSGKIRKRKLNTIYLPKDVSNNLMNDINNFLKPSTKEFYEEMGISYKRIFMLEGPPGSGKTSLMESILHICKHI